MGNLNSILPNIINYPLVTEFIDNPRSWCQRLPVGVRNLLRGRYQAYEEGLNRRLDGYTGGRTQSLRRQFMGNCVASQRETIEQFRNAEDVWLRRNRDWGQLRFHEPLIGEPFTAAVNEFVGGITNGVGPQQEGIRVGHINLNSLVTRDDITGRPDKFDNLRINLVAWNFDIFVVGESKVKGISDQLLQIDGYRLVRLDRDYPGEGHNSGGVLVYVRIREDMQCNVIRAENRDRDDEHSLLQLIDIELVFPNQPRIRVVAVYNPPWNGCEQAMGRLFDEYRNVGQDIIILGDININILNDMFNHHYQAYFQGLNFRQCIQQITRPSNQAGTLIDHIYTQDEDEGRLVLESGVIGIQGFADHHLIFCTLRLNQPGGQGGGRNEMGPLAKPMSC